MFWTKLKELEEERSLLVRTTEENGNNPSPKCIGSLVVIGHLSNTVASCCTNLPLVVRLGVTSEAALCISKLKGPYEYDFSFNELKKNTKQN